ncbi:MAG: nicotinamide-nucleotide amidohydrolase family protein [Coriobacteriia bacterium]|nr:nicotinamide-nucleotide amidohydrolase family protein [Coriobacteriia bacterium]
MSDRPLAAVVGVGTELVTGLRTDTNTAEIAAALLGAGFRVAEMVRVADDATLISATLRRLTGACSLVVVTGGLGPTHDDITREAAADALGVSMSRDPETERRLQTFTSRHRDPDARRQLFTQADVLEGATVVVPTLGTAPGQTVPTPMGHLVLLPGPPAEMRPMLATLLATLLATSSQAVAPARLRCTGLTESDAQMRVQRALESHPGVELTILASPADIEIVIFDDGAGEAGVAGAADAALEALGEDCYSRDGSTLAQVVVRRAHEVGLRLAVAESCTGGRVAAALTDIPGSSAVFTGGIVAYSDTVKTSTLGVAEETLAAYGAVSSQTAAEMAQGVADSLQADIAVSITGIAGPGGGTADKPVGTVWFGLAREDRVRTWQRSLFGDREGVRIRATVEALDAMRREMQGS